MTETTVACLQMESTVGEPERNIATATHLAREAAANGAHLLILPELCTSGYVLASREEARALAEPIPDGPASTAFTELCAETGCYLVAGIAERAGEALYNTAALFGPEGLHARYRKLHLWDTENLFFEPGDAGITVCTTPLGRIGMAICYDAWFPEMFRGCAARGADLVVMPVNWVPGPADSEDAHPVGVALAIASATCNGMAIAMADRVGIERGTRFLGSSAIIGAQGHPLAPIAGEDDQQIVHAEIDLATIRGGRSWSPYNHLLHDRRPEIYGPLP